jgi:hypothetical protein
MARVCGPAKETACNARRRSSMGAK